MRASSVGIAAILLLAPTGVRSGGRAAEGGPSHAAAVASLGGPSWLRTLAITVDETKLGHMGGGGPAPVSARSAAFQEDVRRAVALAGSNDAAARASLEALVTVDGADIYRLECRSCHGPNGRGEPPEVGSIVGLVRALSPALLEENMRGAGRPARPDLARQLAEEAEKTLAERLRDGGKRMPPFRYLSDAEREGLVRYLKQLAQVPAAKAEHAEVPESAARLGELLVQGTCRICHDATGPGGGHMMMMMGRIPALASIPEQLSLEAVVHKVRHGWSGMAGMMRHRISRMPVFSYLSEEEVAAAYLYLAYYPAKD
jgi:mono/diheme cytochrome c family protein